MQLCYIRHWFAIIIVGRDASDSRFATSTTVIGSDYTVSNRQCLGPHTVKQAFLHSLLQCPNMGQFSNAVSKYGSVLKLLRTGTLALPFEVGPANNTRGF